MDEQKPSTSVWDSYRRAGDRFGGENVMHETPTRIRGSLHRVASIEPLVEINANVLSEKSQAVVLDEYAKHFRRLSEENRILRDQVTEQQKQIRNLERIVKALQSDVDSSESRYDRSASTNSSVPINRVTPQKRDPRSPRSPRNIRSAPSRRLSFTQNGTPQNTPSRGFIRSRQILREAGLDSDILQTSSDQSTPRARPSGLESSGSVQRYFDNSNSRVMNESRDTLSTPDRPGSPNRTFVLSERPERAATLPRPSSNPVRRTVDRSSRALDESQEVLVTPTQSERTHRTFIRTEPRNIGGTRSDVPVPEPQIRVRNGVRREIMRLSSASSSTSTMVDRHEDDTNTPGYYLRTMRPNFIRNLENRKSKVKEAAIQRRSIEERKKNAAKGLATGAFRMDQVLDVLLADSTKVTAFSPREMKEMTKRRLRQTTQFTKVEVEKQKRIDVAANKIVTMCYNLKTQMTLKSRAQSMPSIHQ